MGSGMGAGGEGVGVGSGQGQSGGGGQANEVRPDVYAVGDLWMLTPD